MGSQPKYLCKASANRGGQSNGGEYRRHNAQLDNTIVVLACEANSLVP